MKIQLFADSAANKHTLDTLKVNYAPLKIETSEKTYVDDDSLNVREMMDDLKKYKGKSTTACPSLHDWTEAFADADIALGVSITSGLSGSYNAGHLACEQYMEENPGKKAYILDSRSTGPEEQLILEKYQEFIDKGMTFEEIVEAIEEYHKHTHLIFALTSLDNLAKNGRVSTLVAKAIGILGIRVVGIASAEGTLEPRHKSRGDKKAIKHTKEDLIELGYKGGKVRVTHSYNEELANEYAAMIKEEWPDCDITVSLNGGLCSFYAEEGSVLVAFEDSNE